MDLYFIVAELAFPAGSAAAWRTSKIAPTRRHPKGTTIDAVLASAEGPVRLDVRGDAVSLRAFLVDSAYFVIRDELESALAEAAKRGAKGRWYSGDHVAGQLVTSSGAPERVEVHRLPVDVRGWIDEASALESGLPDTRHRADPSARGPTRASPASPSPKKSSPAKRERPVTKRGRRRGT